MFKGFTKELKDKIETYNQNSENFVFCVSDLEYSSDRREGEQKFDIHSEELKQELESAIVSNGGKISKPRAIEFPGLSFQLYFKGKGTKNYKSWIKVNKKHLAELNKSNSRKIIRLFDKVYSDWQRLQPNWEPAFEVFDVFALTRKLGFCSQDMWKIESLEKAEIEKRNRSIFKAGGDALKEINQTLSDTNIDIETAEIDWLDILSNWCHCEVREFGNSANNSLHSHHINSCLWREESEINDFKKKMVEAIKKGGVNFDNYKDEIIQEIIKKAKEKRNEWKRTKW